MDSVVLWPAWPVRLGVGLAGGAAIAYVDNFAFEGKVSRIIIVAMLLAATATGGAVWGWRGWVTAAAAWACVPVAHVIKHVLGLPSFSFQCPRLAWPSSSGTRPLPFLVRGTRSLELTPRRHSNVLCSNRDRLGRERTPGVQVDSHAWFPPALRRP